MSTILLVNRRATLLDLTGVQDVTGKRVLLAPQGKPGDTAECDAEAEQHPNVQAMKNAKWLEVRAADLKPAAKAKPEEPKVEESKPVEPPAPPAEDAPPTPPVLAEAQAAVDAAPPADTAGTETVAGVDTVTVEGPSSAEQPLEGGKKKPKQRW